MAQKHRTKKKDPTACPVCHCLPSGSISRRARARLLASAQRLSHSPEGDKPTRKLVAFVW
uniref:Uncharacterized protein n=1 Tax=Arundo donax TaxID=35708 RepID=A0A0A8ZLV1_ARUDO